MATFDEIFDKAKDLAVAAGKKTGEVVEVSKLRLNRTSISSEIDKAYQKLGSVVYDLHKSGMENTDLVDACLKEIDILLEKYWELSAQIDDYRNVVKCPACGASNPAQASYCIRCGYQIGSEE